MVDQIADMDDTDRRLIAALRHNARASHSDLALELGVARATIRARIDRLVNKGEIVGFSVVTRADVARDPVRALMMIGIEGRGTDRVLRQMGGLAEVRSLYSTNGRWDVIAELGARNLEALDTVLARVRRFDGIATSETSLLLSVKKAVS